MAKHKKKVEIIYPPVTCRKWRPPRKDLPHDPRRKKKFTRRPIWPQNKYFPHCTVERTWHHYKILSPDCRILFANVSQAHPKYLRKFQGKQGPANCCCAIAFTKLVSMELWMHHLITFCLDMGMRIHSDSYMMFHSKTPSPTETVNSFFIGDAHFTLAIDNGIMKGTIEKAEKRDIAGLYDILGRYLFDKTYCILLLDKYFMAIWKWNQSFYVFDPNDRDELGRRCKEGKGKACVMRFTKIKSLVLWITDDYLVLDRDIEYVLTPVEIRRWVRVNLRPPDTLEDYEKFMKPTQIQLCSSKTVTMAESQNVDVLIERKLEKEDSDIKIAITPSQVTLKEPLDYEGTYRKPIERPKCPSITYFMPIVPEMSGIIRASYNQNDPKFSRNPGKQSLANAIAALAMLREFKSKYWIKKILDEILIAGERIFAESKNNLMGDQELGIREIIKRITIGSNIYVPEIEEYTVIGRLNSTALEVLDLLESLREFFKYYDIGIIRGPVLLAVWKEDGKYYMFDPNARDANGKTIPKYEINEAEKNEGLPDTMLFQQQFVGSACLTWFTNLSDLVHLYIDNLSKEMVKSYFYISKVEIKDYIEEPTQWNNFLPITIEKWILRGTIAQNSQQFQSSSRNLQCTAVAAMAIVYGTLRSLEIWDRNTVDEIVFQGDGLYNECIEILKLRGKYKDPMLMIAEVPKKLTVNDRNLVLEVEDCIINGMLTENEPSEFPDLKQGLYEFFKTYDSGVLTSRFMTVALWREGDAYYYFDSHARDKLGHIDCTGTACVIRTLTIDDLLNAVQCNFIADANSQYNISFVGVKLLPESGGLPEHDKYVLLGDCKAILRGYIHQGLQDLYDINADKQTIANVLVALGMNQVLPSFEWFRETIDEIITIGNKLYEKTKREFCEDDNQLIRRDEEDRERDDDDALGEEITIDNVIKTFVIGLNQLTASYKHQYTGIFEENLFSFHKRLEQPGEDPEEIDEEEEEEGGGIQTLPTILSDYMEKDDDPGKECLLISEPLTIALWRDDSYYYLFDPLGRDKEGFVYGRDLWSARENPPDYPWLGGEGDNEQLMKQHGEDKLISPSPTANEINDEEDDEDEEGDFVGENDGMEEMERVMIDYSDARACTIMFCNLKELISHIITNVPPNKRDMTFKLIPIFLDNQPFFKHVNLTKDWFSFAVLDEDTWILRGTTNMFDQRYPNENRGQQAVAMSVLADVYARLYGILEFTSYIVDDIVKYGDRLHTITRQRRQRNLSNLSISETDIRVSLRRPYKAVEVENKFYVASIYLVELFVLSAVIKGDLTANEQLAITQEPSDPVAVGQLAVYLKDESPVLSLKQGILNFFEKYKFGLLSAKGVSVAIWNFNDTYYMFDPDERGPSGLSEINGVACITRYKNINKLITVFKKNLVTEGSNDFTIDFINAKIRKQPKPEAKVEKIIPTDPKITAFDEIDDGKMILRGDFNMNNPRFGRPVDATACANALVAIAMAHMRKSDTWTALVINDVLIVGNCVYDLTQDILRENFNPWEDKMTLDIICKEFPLGDCLAKCEVGERDVTGILYIKDPQIYNLRKGCEYFFRENRYGIIQSQTLITAIWTEDNLFYMFDPYPRSSTGLSCISGAACLMIFNNLKLLSDHYICNVPKDMWDMEFIITPVTVEINNCKKKKKKPLKKCEILKWQKLDLNDYEKNPPQKPQPTPSVKPKDNRLCKICNKPRRIKRKVESSSTITESRKQLVRQTSLLKAKKERELHLRKMLHQFYPITDNTSILRAHYSQSSNKYCEQTRDYQALPNCITALVMSRIHDINNWTYKNIEIILDSGDVLYKNSYMYFKPENPLLGLKNVLRQFYIQHIAISTEIYLPIIKASLSKQNLQVALMNFFMQEKAGILEIRLNKLNQIFLAVFQRTGSLYVFYPYDVNERGQLDPKGSACVVKCQLIEEIAENIINNYETDEVSRFGLSAISVIIGRQVDIDE